MRRSARVSTIAALVGLSSVIATAPTPGAAALESKKPRPASQHKPLSDVEKLMVAQYPLDRAAEQLSSVIKKEGYAGLASLQVGVETHSVTLHWKGLIPQKLQSAIDDIRARGISVQLSHAKYSLSDLQMQSTSLIADERAHGIASKYKAQMIVPLPDGSGLEVRVQQRDSTTERRRQGYAVVRTTEFESNEPLTRLDDTEPYWGGSRIIIQGGGSCSSGFAATDGSHDFLLTAGHCGDLLGPGGGGGAASAVYNGAGNVIGNVAGIVNALQNSDSMLINVPSSDGWVYDGAYNNADGYAKPVLAWSDSFVDDYVCTSGSYSGVRCSIKVLNPNAVEVIGSGTVTGVVEAESTDGSSAAGNGDSGGSVFGLASDPDQVIALGLVSSSDKNTQVPCTGVTGTRRCFSRIYYLPINTALSDYGNDLVLKLGA